MVTRQPSSSSVLSIATWIKRLKEDESKAASQLWERYSERMLRLSRKRLRTAQDAAFDEEDIALSAFNAFCVAVKNGKYSPPPGHDDLWPLLATFTIRKANDWSKYERAAKRSHGSPETNSQAISQADNSELTQLPDPEIGPDAIALVADECRRLLTMLNDAELEQVVVLKLDGYTNDEIANKIGRTRRTVQRMLNLIRERWKHEIEGDAAAESS